MAALFLGSVRVGWCRLPARPAPAGRSAGSAAAVPSTRPARAGQARRL